eukprot:11210028-Lingulodinium_polyedra.AAC.1
MTVAPEVHDMLQLELAKLGKRAPCICVKVDGMYHWMQTVAHAEDVNAIIRSGNFKFDDQTANTTSRFLQRVGALNMWHSSNSNRIELISQKEPLFDFVPFAKLFEPALAWGERSQQDIARLISSAIDEDVKVLEEACPPLSILNDSRLLVVPDLQQA